MCRLLSELLPLDDVLDVVLVLAAEVIVSPPHWSLVFAAEAKVLAGSAHGRALIALLASQSASVAPYATNGLLVTAGWLCKWEANVPVRERRCIWARDLVFPLPALEADLALAD